ncbi:MAG: TonB-dependent receptor [Rhodospirillaceae bacterium]|nr:TonB-dependent receptor [Rhodospirillaceae bacterium]
MIRDRLLATAAFVLAVTAVQLPVAPRAQAQQQSAQSGGLEEIIVTARKREESLLEVPLSISAITELQIERSGINNMTDLASQTVGFTYHQGFGRLGSGQGGGASNRPSIRGMSNILGGPNTGFFVDGVYVAGNPSSYQLDNLERIEVIRGPQSAQLGRGTFAGAVNFITRKPTNDVKGKLEVTVGEYDHYEGTGYVSGPIIEDKLYAEVNGRYYTFGGDYKNAVTGKRDIGDQKSKNVGGKIVVTPTENLTIEFNAGYSHDQDLGFADFFNGNAKNNCFLPNIVGTVSGLPRSSTRSAGYFCGEIELPNTFYYFNDAIKASGEYGSDRAVERYNAKVDYDFNDWTLTYIAAYDKSKDKQLIDQFVDGNRRLGATAAADTTVLSGGVSGVNDWSQEFRIQSPQRENIRGLVGAYMYREGNTAGIGDRIVSVRPETLGQIRINPTGLAYGEDATGVQNHAVFGSLEGDLSDDFTVTVEGRYQEDEVYADFNRDGVVEKITTASGTRELRAKYKSFLPRFTARYDLDDISNVYLNIAKGNKPGGFNNVPVNNMVAADIAAVFAAGAERYDEEKLWTYEVGYKASLLERRATVTAAAFYNDWSNQGLTVGYPYLRISPASPTTFPRIVNAGKSRIRGLELDTNVKATDFFDFRVGYSYNDAEIRDYVDETERDLRDTDGQIGNEATQGDPTGQVRGRKIPQTPAHQLIITGNFHTPITNSLEAFFRSDLTYESNRWAQVQNLAGTGDSYLLNLKAGIEADNWTLTAFVNNALNDKTPTVVTRLFNFNSPLVIPDPVLRAVGPNTRLTFFRDFRVGAPRKQQFGVTALYKF